MKEYTVEEAKGIYLQWVEHVKTTPGFFPPWPEDDLRVPISPEDNGMISKCWLEYNRALFFSYYATPFVWCGRCNAHHRMTWRARQDGCFRGIEPANFQVIGAVGWVMEGRFAGE